MTVTGKDLVRILDVSPTLPRISLGLGIPSLLFAEVMIAITGGV